MGWLITLGILTLLAILPLGAKMVYDSAGFALDIIAGPVRIPVLPKKKDAPQKEKKKKVPETDYGEAKHEKQEYNNKKCKRGRDFKYRRPL